jgi:hypothetical protein
MRKKLILICLALMTVVVAPTTASATNDPEVTSPTGTLAPVGTQFLATNVGESTSTDTSGNVLTRCTATTMTGALTKNDGANVEGNITSVTFTGTAPEGRCTSSFGNIAYTFSPATNGLPWCIRSTSTMATDEVQIRGNACANAARPIRIVLHSSTVGECVYERTTAIIGTYATDISGQDATISLSKQLSTKISGSFLCPAEVLYNLTMTLEKDTTASADPLYIS